MAGEAGENIHKSKKGQGGSSEVLVSSNACEASCVIGLQLSKYREHGLQLSRVTARSSNSVNQHLQELR
jgi:hypothetical protein